MVRLWASKMNDLLACRRRAGWLYVDRIRKMDRPDYFKFGSLAHIVHAFLLHPWTWRRCAEERRLELAHRMVGMLEVDTQTERELLEKMVETFDYRGFDGFEPLVVEMKLEGVFGDSVLLFGRADGFMKRGEEIWLVEFKTTSRWGASIIESAYLGNFQLLFYAYLLGKVLRRPVSGILATVFVKRAKNPEFLVEPIPLPKSGIPGDVPVEDIERMVAQAVRIAEEVEAGDRTPWFGSCFGPWGSRCEMFELCRYGDVAKPLYGGWDPEEHLVKGLVVEEIPKQIKEEAWYHV